MNFKQLTKLYIKENTVDVEYTKEPIYKKMVSNKEFDDYADAGNRYPPESFWNKLEKKYSITKSKAKMFYKLWVQETQEEVDREDMPKKGYQK